VGKRLTRAAQAEALSALAAADRDLGSALASVGAPPFWTRPPGFETLVRLVTEQSVSLAAAEAVFGRLEQACRPLAASNLGKMTENQLRVCGYSMQKAGYLRAIAAAVDDGFDLAELVRLDDDEARRQLVALRGVGPWTADNYLLFALRRPDVFPEGDRALQVGTAEVKGLAAVPTPKELLTIAEVWRPWRAVAARLIWHHYLSVRGRSE
jgi:DNA-3-methyladenine glycosylase II